MKKFGRFIIIALFVCIAIGAIVFVAVKPVPFFNSEFVEVKEGNLPIIVEAQGEVVAHNYQKVSASALFRSKSSLVDRIRIKSLVPEGKKVKCGDEIAVLDRASILDAVRKANVEAIDLQNKARNAVADTANQLQDLRYNLSNLRINMEIAQINMEQSLYDPPAAQRKTKLEFQKSKIVYDQGLQKYIGKKKELERNIESLDNMADEAFKRELELQKIVNLTSVKAPRSGVVYYYSDLAGEKRVAGSYITPGDLTVALMLNESSLYIENYINEDAAARVRVAQKAEVAMKMIDGKVFNGEVADISAIPEMVSGQKMYKVSVRLTEQSDLIRPMMTTATSIILGTKLDLLYIPAKSLSKENGKYYVFTKDHRKQEVEIGGKSHDNMIVMRGLAKGEDIYSEPPVNPARFKLVQL